MERQTIRKTYKYKLTPTPKQKRCLSVPWCFADHRRAHRAGSGRPVGEPWR